VPFIVGLSLVACGLTGTATGTSTEQPLDCNRDSIKLLDAKRIEAQQNFDGSSWDKDNISNLALKWAELVLEAPRGCYSESDINRAKEWSLTLDFQ
jgi:hypothetical protein